MSDPPEDVIYVESMEEPETSEGSEHMIEDMTVPNKRLPFRFVEPKPEDKI